MAYTFIGVGVVYALNKKFKKWTNSIYLQCLSAGGTLVSLLFENYRLSFTEESAKS